MPQNEMIWNPYRMVPVQDEQPGRRNPLTHELFQGMSGEVEAKLTTLTPLLIGVQEGSHKRHIYSNLLPIIPGSSLKGMLRSLAELVGNGCDVTNSSDPKHHKCEASDKLCISCRMFGMQHKKNSFMGKVFCGEGKWHGEGQPKILQQQRVLLANPKARHTAFYTTSKNVRKIYHHNPACKDGPQLDHNQQRENMVAYLHPIAADETFIFRVDFSNLEEDEFALLLYCLTLEKNITLMANGREHTGDLYHKLGMGKPIGMGSVKIDITKLTIQAQESIFRYRTWEGTDPKVYIGEALHKEIMGRTMALCGRRDKTMTHLRSMLLWLTNENRTFRYPEPSWFDTHSITKLKDPITGK